MSRTIDRIGAPRKSQFRLFGLGLVAIATVVVAVGEVGTPHSSARATEQLVTAEKGVVESTVSGSGNLGAASDVSVNFATGGTLAHVYVKAGQRVRKGQLLAKLDAASVELSLEQARLSLTAAEDSLTSAESSSSSGTATTSSASSSSSAGSVASAKASVDSAEANVVSAEQALAETVLRAPAAGTIVSLASLSPGDSVSAGSTGSTASSTSSSASSSSSAASTTSGSVGGSSSSASSSSAFAEIVNLRRLTMTVAFGESDISKIHVGQAATVTLDALTGVELSAHVSAISTVAITSSSVVSYDATLTLDQYDPRVKLGMSASASVVVGHAAGVTVPSQAVSGSGSLATVELVRDGRTTTKQVVVGARGDSRDQIVAGLSAGDQLLIQTTLPSVASSGSSGSSSGGTLGSTGFSGGALSGGGAPPGGFPGGGG